MVIMGGYSFEAGQTKRTVKRHWQEILSIGRDPIPTLTKSNRHPLSFTDANLRKGKPNEEIPLIISAVLAGVDVKRILVDQGSSVDIQFKELLPKLKISEADLSVYDSSDLVGFNGSRTKPLGYLKLRITYGDDKLSKTIKTRFLVLPCNSPYHCIVGRPTLGKLGAVASTVHLKMRFFSKQDEVVTVSADLDGARRFQYLCLKSERQAEKQQALTVTKQENEKKE